jgi:ferredoxin
MSDLLELLNSKKMFKLVCGAGNEDEESVKRLVYIYSKAGCEVFDLSARKNILEAAKEGAKLAQKENIHFCVSVGIKGDPHISKSFIQAGKCIHCGTCYRNCPNNAIYSSIVIDEKKCIGCGICAKKCPTNAIKMIEKDVNVANILPYMSQNGVEILELHVMGHDKKDLETKWKVINECQPKFASICIDRENFGNKEVLTRIKEMISSRPPYTTIIQADGIPMSGCDDRYKTTLQAVAMAEIIQNAQLPVYIVVSGGTNSKTAELCKLCEIDFHGIAIGSWARKILKPQILSEDFWDNKTLQNELILKAKELITSCA